MLLKLDAKTETVKPAFFYYLSLVNLFASVGRAHREGHKGRPTKKPAADNTGTASFSFGQFILPIGLKPSD